MGGYVCVRERLMTRKVAVLTSRGWNVSPWNISLIGQRITTAGFAEVTKYAKVPSDIPPVREAKLLSIRVEC
jgi:hypothetical protein